LSYLNNIDYKINLRIFQAF